MNTTNTANVTNSTSLIHDLHLTIDPNILLQIDATVIAGILILLTVSSFTGEGVISLRIPFDWNPRSIVAVTTIPFSVSALSLVWASMTAIPTANVLTVVIAYLLNAFVAPMASVFGFAYMVWIALSMWFAKEYTSRNRSFFEKSIILLAKIFIPLIKYDKNRERRKRRERDIKKLQKMF